MQGQIRTAPMQFPKTVRREGARGVTSTKAGKFLPVKAIPVLPGDRVSSGQFSVRVDMQETPLPLMNAVGVKAMAHFVPMLALERFDGMDALNKAMMGVGDIDYFNTIDAPVISASGGVYPQNFYTAMGIHPQAGSQINTTYVEAFNAIWNHQARARNKSITPRDQFDTSIPPAFWDRFGHIKSSYDEAMIDGDVPIEFDLESVPIGGDARIRGMYARSGQNYNANTGFTDIDGNTFPGGQSLRPDTFNTTNQGIYIDRDAFGPDLELLYADLTQASAKITLASINQARQTMAFAKVRKSISDKVGDVSDDYITDLLMRGVRIPDLHLQHPILLDVQRSIIGLQQQLATDGASLGESVSFGQGVLDLRFSTPELVTGGVIMITLQIVPEPIFERQRDPFMFAQNFDDLPNAERDFLDEKKVRIVQNGEIDVQHGTPDGVFGYAPLNSQWDRDVPNIGGKYYRKQGDGWKEDRSRIWSPEVTDPALVEDWYLTTDIDHQVFSDQDSDPFEVGVYGGASIVGITQFGRPIYEDGNEYQETLDNVNGEEDAQA